MILNSNIWFPECRRYEDNYWGTLLCAYVKKIYFIQERLYYYRLNLNSTTNANNQLYHFDRLSIEEDLQEEFKNRGYDSKNFKTLITVTNKKENTESKYYVVAVNEFKEWVIQVLDSKPDNW